MNGKAATPTIPVTAMVFTLNEEVNLPFCLTSVEDFGQVFVVDSYSDDRTRAISHEHGALFVQHRFTGFGSQRNWALDHLQIEHDWVLMLDADERVPAALACEIAERLENVGRDVSAFRLKRRFYLWGRWLKRSSLYPSWVVRLVHKDRVRYVNRGHAETQQVDGTVEDLDNDLVDDNRKGLEEWYSRQNRYSTQDAQYELAEQRKPLDLRQLLAGDPLTRRAALKRVAYRLPARSLVYFLYSYIWRRGFLDGKDGLMFCRMRAAYQGMIAVKKHELQRNRKRGSGGGA